MDSRTSSGDVVSAVIDNLTTEQSAAVVQLLASVGAQTVAMDRAAANEAAARLRARGGKDQRQQSDAEPSSKDTDADPMDIDVDILQQHVGVIEDAATLPVLMDIDSDFAEPMDIDERGDVVMIDAGI
ncbi:hypothetical protein MAPG_08720 [Magnaporthiopsis poae ATCC 64411]|uniref:Uncharacterized protein n=1 Tax=Magnaporthiopsis poae (strain ATCC 64411 / 73-15) TaxID=644358 RepID=A0A0C4E833_MAGP6|nr:hypothetical protein MAPG_08720 [Magnaporthiopsis poae ATCC 64411]